MNDKLLEYGDFFEKMGLTELSVEEGAFKVHMKRDSLIEVVSKPIPVKKTPKVENNISSTDVKAPLLGTFHPNQDTLVDVGKNVKKGDVLCSIEAMKMFNEVVSPCDGKVVSVGAKDGDLVEYDQVLFQISEV